MKSATFLQNLRSKLVLTTSLSILFSCGSYEYIGLSDDGIYGPSNPDYSYSEQQDSNSDRGNSYYKDFFKGKANEYANADAEVFTDIDSYSGQYDSDSNNEDNYGGWGQNSDSRVVVNIQTRPSYFAMGWGWNDWGWNRWGWNRWGWNSGWNVGWNNNWGWNIGWNWGYSNYGYWDPFYFNTWNSPYYWGGYGYIVPYTSRNIVYANSYRNTGYRTSSLSSRSALGTVSRTRASTTRSSSSNTNNYYNSTRPSSNSTRSSTRSSNSYYNNSDSTPTTTRSTRSTNQSTRPTTTTRSSRSTTRSGGSSYRPSSSSQSSTTRSSGGSTRSSRGGGTQL